MEVIPLTAQIGAEICGLDVGRLDSETFDILYQTWLDHQVLLIRDQDLDDDSLQAFAGRFGPLQERPFGNISEEEKKKFISERIDLLKKMEMQMVVVGYDGKISFPKKKK